MNKINTQSGSALFVVLIALLLVTSLYSAVILYGSYHRRLALRDVLDTKAFYLAESGIEAALARLNQDHNYNFSLSEQIEASGRYEADIKPYGVWLLCTSKGISGTREKILRCLIGAVPEPKFKNALNLGGQNFPLTLAGRTSITGDVLVSPSGVLPGRFKGKRFGSERLVFGEIKQSSFNRLPQYDDNVLKQFQEEIGQIRHKERKIIDRTFILDNENAYIIEKDSVIQFRSDLIIDLAEKVFDLTNKYFQIKGDLTVIHSSRIYGFGVIDVEGEVILDDNCYLKDVIISAQNDIFMKGNSAFGGQFISNSKVEISQSAYLTGNAVVVNTGELTDIDRCIYIESSQQSHGILFCDLQSNQNNRPGRPSMFKSIDLSNYSDFNGIIYNTGYSKISGKIIGNLSTASLYIYDAPTVYINWLVDAIITSGDVFKTVPVVFAGETGYAKVGGL